MSKHGGRAEIRKFVEDLKNHGLRFDLNPTHAGGDLMKVEVFWHDYVRQMNESVRERAAKVLKGRSDG